MLADVQFASALLQWDQETVMPEKGASLRAQQLATLSEIGHNIATDEFFGKGLNKLILMFDENTDQKINLIHSLKDFNNRKKFSTDFIKKMSMQVSYSFNAWQNARKKKDFNLFSNELDKLIALKIDEAEILGYQNHPYDALLNQYEPGLTVEFLKPLFKNVRDQLVPFVKSLIGKNISNEFMYLHYDKKQQWDLGIKVLNDMGYDFSAGRQDESAHPFTISFNSKDVRVTTRIDENNFNEMLWSCIHEGGHALYEQGLLIENYGLPMGEAVSLSIHESQSRLWENNVGRSKEFIEHYWPTFKHIFPNNLNNISANEFYKAVNEVKPSLIRTNADELTYHLHIMIRFEMELAIMERKVATKELPQLWNTLYESYLGIKVPDDSMGILQDVHWSHGSFGYFPTYSLGSFYAAQFFYAAKNHNKELMNDINNGEFSNLLSWLRENIHVHGKRFSSSELCKRITGEELNFKYFYDYVVLKYSQLYND